MQIKKINIFAMFFCSLMAIGEASLAEVVKVTTGHHDTCVLTAVGSVKCWGENWHGSVGDGSIDDRYSAVDVVGLSSGVQNIAGGDGHTCALLSTGGVKCWGYNPYGQIGDGSTTMRTTPTNVQGLSSGVVAIAAGYYHSCALLNTGSVQCWGYNYYGQLGNGTTDDSLTPVTVIGLPGGVASIFTGTNHTCAVTSGGAAYCWGSNGYGQLGDNTYTDRLTPISVFSLSSGVTAIAGGDSHTCALKDTGGVVCWGYNSSGQVGNGDNYTQLTPVNVLGLTSGVSNIEAGWSHTCAVLTSGAVKCWGYNGKGQLGDGTLESRLQPTDVLGLASGMKAVAGGRSHSCVLTTLGGVKCWGENSNGEVGDGTIIQRLSPVDSFLWTVGGRFTSGGSGLSGVVLDCAGHHITSNATGYFSFGPVVHLTSCVINPSKNGYYFNPSSVNLSVTADNFLSFTTNIPVTDSDKDGLTDDQEAVYGTNPHLFDTDGDGVSDGQEVLDHTSPTDAGSVLQTLSSTLCSDWNGFLGMTNIVEHVNLSSGTIGAASHFYDIAGKLKATTNITIKNGGQFDLIVNSLKGFSSKSYGKICVSITKGTAGDLDGRMVYYKPGAITGTFQFAFAMPFGNGSAGSQFVHFDTHQPSKIASDAGNLVTNWVQVTNLVASAQKGTLHVYSASGAKLGSIGVSVPAGGRVDIDAHRYGSNKLGLVEFVPNNSQAKFQLRNIRYYFDNAVADSSFDAAYPWEGSKGTSAKTVLPIDTRSSDAEIFVSNTTSGQVTANVSIYSTSGDKVKSLSAKLAAHATWTIDASDYIRSAEGVATISSSSVGGLISSVTQVLHNNAGGIQSLYAVHSTQALGSVLRGSYNTFLNQGCSLLLTNTTSQKVNVSVSMKRYDGTSLIKGKSIAVAGNGLVDYDLCANDTTPAYGLVTVQPSITNSIVATVLRKGATDSAGDSYRFPTPVRE